MSDYLLGIDVGGTMINGALFDQDGYLVAKEEIPTQSEKGSEAFIDNLVSLAVRLQEPKNKALGMGIGIAGLLDKERRTLLESPNLPLLNNLLLKQHLESRLDLPVSIENDANAAAPGRPWSGLSGRPSTREKTHPCRLSTAKTLTI
jgi:glucokinase